MTSSENKGFPFVGREAEVQLLEHCFLADPSEQRRVAVLHGQPGVGKTALAHYYAAKCDSSYPGGVYWLNADSYASFYQSVYRCVSFQDLWTPVAGYEENLSTFYLSLSHSVKSLLIFDNADRVELLNDCLPSIHQNVDVIVCTKSQGSNESAVWLDPRMKKITLGKLSEEEALEVLINSCQKSDLDEEDLDKVKTLAKTYDLPLSLHFAAKQIQISGLSLASSSDKVESSADFPDKNSNLDTWLNRYDLTAAKSRLSARGIRTLEGLKDISSEVLQQIKAALSPIQLQSLYLIRRILQGNEPIAHIWEFMFANLQHECPASYELLLFCALLGSAPIPDYLLRDCLEVSAGPDVPLERAIDPLIQNGFFVRNNASCYCVHPFVQFTLRQRYVLSVDQLSLKLQILCGLTSKYFPKLSDISQWRNLDDSRFIELLPHAVSLVLPLFKLRFQYRVFEDFVDLVRVSAIILGLPCAREFCERSVHMGALFPDLLTARYIDYAHCFLDEKKSKEASHYYRLAMTTKQNVDRDSNGSGFMDFKCFLLLSKIDAIERCQFLKNELRQFQTEYQVTSGYLEAAAVAVENVDRFEETKSVVMSCIAELRKTLENVTGETVEAVIDLKTEQLGAVPYNELVMQESAIYLSANPKALQQSQSLTWQKAVNKRLLKLWKLMLIAAQDSASSSFLAKVRYILSWVKYLKEMEDYDKAIQLGCSLLQYEQLFLPRGHLVTIQVLQLLGDCYGFIGNVQEGCKCYQRILQSAHKSCLTLNRENELLETRMSLAKLCFSCDPNGAAEILSECVSILESKSENCDPLSCYRFMVTLSELLYQHEKYDDVCQLLVRADEVVLDNSEKLEMERFGRSILLLHLSARAVKTLAKSLMKYGEYEAARSSLLSTINKYSEDEATQWKELFLFKKHLGDLHFCLAECAAAMKDRHGCFSNWEQAYVYYRESKSLCDPPVLIGLAKMAEYKISFDGNWERSAVPVEGIEMLKALENSGVVDENSLRAVDRLCRFFAIGTANHREAEKCKAVTEAIQAKLNSSSLSLTEDDDVNIPFQLLEAVTFLDCSGVQSARPLPALIESLPKESSLGHESTESSDAKTDAEVHSSDMKVPAEGSLDVHSKVTSSFDFLSDELHSRQKADSLHASILVSSESPSGDHTLPCPPIEIPAKLQRAQPEASPQDSDPTRTVQSRAQVEASILENAEENSKSTLGINSEESTAGGRFLQTKDLFLIKREFSNNPPSGRRVIALLGPAGSGKTSLAKIYADECRDRYSENVYWFDADSSGSIYYSVYENLKSIWKPGPLDGYEENLVSLYLVLSARARCLLVFDNATKLDVVRDALPPEDFKADILICVRTSVPSAQMESSFIRVWLSVLNEQEALDLLCVRSGLQVSGTDSCARSFIASQVKESLPMTVGYAADRIRETGMSFLEYFDKFKKHCQTESTDSYRINALLGRFKLGVRVKRQLSVMGIDSVKKLQTVSVRSLELSWEESEVLSVVRNIFNGKEPEVYPWEIEISKLSTAIRELFLFCSVLGPVVFPGFLLKRCLKAIYQSDSLFGDCISELTQLGFIIQEAGETYRIPSLIQSSIRRRYLEGDFSSKFRTLLSSIVRSCPTVDAISRGRCLHKFRFLTMLPTIFSVMKPLFKLRFHDSSMTELLRKTAMSLHLPGALDVCRESAGLLPDSGGTPVSRLCCRLDFVRCLLRIGDVETSTAQLEEVKKDMSPDLHQESPDIFLKFQFLSNLLQVITATKMHFSCCHLASKDVRNFSELPERFLISGLDLLEFSSGEASHILFLLLEDSEDAKEMMETVLKKLDVSGSSIFSKTLFFSASFSQILRDTKQLQSRMSEHLPDNYFHLFNQKGKTFWQTILQNYPVRDTVQQKITYFSAWVMLLITSERFEEAAEISREVLRLQRQFLPEGHYLLLNSLQSLGECYASLGQSLKAVACYEEVLKPGTEICSKWLDVVYVKSALAHAASTVNPTFAERCFKEVVDFCLKQKSRSISLFWAQTNLVEFYHDHDQYWKVIDIADRTQSFRKERFSREESMTNPDSKKLFFSMTLARHVLAVAQTLVVCYANYVEAMSILLDALPCFQELYFYPSTSKTLADIYLCLAECFAANGDKECLSYWENAYDLYCKHYSLDRPALMRALAKLVQCKVYLLKLENCSPAVVERLQAIGDELLLGKNIVSILEELRVHFSRMNDDYWAERCQEITVAFQQSFFNKTDKKLAKNLGNFEIPLDWLKSPSVVRKELVFYEEASSVQPVEASADFFKTCAEGIDWDNSLTAEITSPALLWQYAEEFQFETDLLFITLKLKPTDKYSIELRTEAGVRRAYDILEKWSQIQGEKATEGELIKSVEKIWEKRNILISRSLPEGTSRFVGRENYLQKIANLFFSPDSWQKNSVVLLHGPGGVGKTELTLAYAQKNRGRYRGGVFWFNAPSSSALLYSVKQTIDLLQERAGLPFHHRLSQNAPFHQTYQTLQVLFERKERSLLIFDSADRPSVLKKVGFRSFNRHHVLISSRSSDWSESSVCVAERVELGGFSIPFAMKFLIDESNLPNLDDKNSDLCKGAKELVVDIIGCLPLGLYHAALRIRRERLSLQEYLEEVRKYKKSVEEVYSTAEGWFDHYQLTAVRDIIERRLGMEFSSIGQIKNLSEENVQSVKSWLEQDNFKQESLTFAQGVDLIKKEERPSLYVWEVDVEELKSEYGSAYYLLLCCALLGPSPIPLYLMNTFLEELTKEGFTCDSVYGPADHLVRIGLFRTFSLQAGDDSSDNKEYFTLHSLIQKTIRERRFRDGQLFKKMLALVSRCLLRHLPSADDIIQFKKLNDPFLLHLHPHVSALVKPIESFSDFAEFEEIIEISCVLAVALQTPSAIELLKLRVRRTEDQIAENLSLRLQIVYILLERDASSQEAKYQIEKVNSMMKDRFEHYFKQTQLPILVYRSSLVQTLQFALENIIWLQWGCLETARTVQGLVGMSRVGLDVINAYSKKRESCLLHFLSSVFKSPNSLVMSHFGLTDKDLNDEFFRALNHSTAEGASLCGNICTNLLNKVAKERTLPSEVFELSRFWSRLCQRNLGAWHVALKFQPPAENNWSNIKYLLNWIDFLYTAKDYSRAVEVGCLLLALEKTCLPPNHPCIAATLLKLAECYLEKGDRKKAFLRYRKSLKIRSATTSANLSNPKEIEDLITEIRFTGLTKDVEDRLKQLFKDHSSPRFILTKGEKGMEEVAICRLKLCIGNLCYQQRCFEKCSELSSEVVKIAPKTALNGMIVHYSIVSRAFLASEALLLNVRCVVAKGSYEEAYHLLISNLGSPLIENPLSPILSFPSGFKRFADLHVELASCCSALGEVDGHRSNLEDAIFFLTHEANEKWEYTAALVSCLARLLRCKLSTAGKLKPGVASTLETLADVNTKTAYVTQYTGLNLLGQSFTRDLGDDKNAQICSVIKGIIEEELEDTIDDDRYNVWQYIGFKNLTRYRYYEDSDENYADVAEELTKELKEMVSSISKAPAAASESEPEDNNMKKSGETLCQPQEESESVAGRLQKSASSLQSESFWFSEDPSSPKATRYKQGSNRNDDYVIEPMPVEELVCLLSNCKTQYYL